MKDIEESEVFKRAHTLVLEVYRLTERFPNREMFGISSQLRRAALSVTSNLVEGSQRMNQAEYRHFVSLSKGSAAEARYQTRVAYELGYLLEKDFRELSASYERVIRMLRGLYASLDGKRPSRNQEPGPLLPTRNQELGTRNSGAFTLLEVIVALVLMAVLAGIAISRMSGSSRVKLEQAARMMSHDLNFARDWAMTHATSVRVIFDRSTEIYGASYWSVDAGAGAGAWEWISSYSLGSALTVDMDEQFEGVDIADFFIDGASVPTANPPDGVGYTSFALSSLGTPRHAYNGTPLTSMNRVTLSFGSYTEYVSIQPYSGYIYVCSQ
ncbi:MAG: four helix bundle protein [Nitrospirae bacterium]|nr:four helix bundle protein [Nitrospirota bacterium]